MKPEDIRVEQGYDCLKVYFCDVLHVRIKMSVLIGVQSWKQGDKNYYIEYTTTSGSVTTEYDDVIKWRTILAEIDRLL